MGLVLSTSSWLVTKFLTRLSQVGPWQQIFYVPGNHEYYGRSRRWHPPSQLLTPDVDHDVSHNVNQDVYDRSRQWPMPLQLLTSNVDHNVHGKVWHIEEGRKQYQNIEVDKCTCIDGKRLVVSEDMVVCGATLWSAPTALTFASMNDGVKIRSYCNKRLSCQEVVDFHSRDVNSLSHQLTSQPDIYISTSDDEDVSVNLSFDFSQDKKLRRLPNVVMTHHAPSTSLMNFDLRNCRSNDLCDDISSCYYSDCDHLVDKCDYWLYGHTHQPVQTSLLDCQIYSYPIGYPREFEHDSLCFTFDVDLC